MLNKVPNSNDATLVENNVRLTVSVGAQQFSLAAIYSHHAEKAASPETTDNDTITRFVRTEINFALGKNGGYNTQ